MRIAAEPLAPSHAGEIRARHLPEPDRVEAEVSARLKREIVFWDDGVPKRGPGLAPPRRRREIRRVVSAKTDPAHARP